MVVTIINLTFAAIGFSLGSMVAGPIGAGLGTGIGYTIGLVVTDGCNDEE